MRKLKYRPALAKKLKIGAGCCEARREVVPHLPPLPLLVDLHFRHGWCDLLHDHVRQEQERLQPQDDDHPQVYNTLQL